MKLVLVRHADAGNPDPSRWPDDRLRPLTPRGTAEHVAVAAALGRLELGVAHVLTSPLTRACETATITARALGVPEVRVLDALGDRFDGHGVLDALGALPSHAAVVCVGHEPSVSRFAARLLHPDGAVRLAFPKSGVMGLECPGRPVPGGARLLFFWSPRDLAVSLDMGAMSGPPCPAKMTGS